uniref:RING-type domain-containing protein n=1 Tax=Nomascus leucogenys TaxID=61853 RepID=G1RLI2_NOMLE
MSTADLMGNLTDELTCFICLDYFRSPVTTACGHSFCLVCLLRSWEEHNTPVSCPECWRTLQDPHFQPNERLGRLASIARQLWSQVRQSEDEQGSYGRMLAAAKALSDDEQGGSAFVAQSHGVNRRHLSSEAEEHHREKLQEILNLLRVRRKEAQAVLIHEKERVKLCQEETKTCKQVVVSEYMKMHQFLKEEEQLQLQLLEQEERENTRKPRNNEIKLTQQIRSLSKMIRQIYEPLLLQCPEATTTELSLCRITGMKEMLRKFS